MPCQILYYYRLSRQQLMTSFSLRNGPNQPMHTVHKGVLQQTTNIYGNISTNFTPSDNLDWKFKIQATTIQNSYLSSWSLRINILHRGEESYCLHQQHCHKKPYNQLIRDYKLGHNQSPKMSGSFHIQFASVGTLKFGHLYLYNRISECPENFRKPGFSDICRCSSHNIVKHYFKKVATYQAFNSVLV